MTAEAAQALLADLQALGARRTNPVLPLLGEPPRIREGVRYPASALRFGGHGLRAYYHCHGDPWRRTDEHGHFHLFVPAPEGDGWSHLAALSIDDEGQPQAWFTVNNWVTAGPWLAPEVLLTQLDRFLEHAGNDETGLSMTERWLTHMLGLYRETLPDLLAARETTLTEHAGDRALDAVRQDRGIYELSRQAIDLQAMLIAQLGLQDAG